MRLAYIDEAYTKEQFCVVSLVVPATAARQLERAMADVVGRVHKQFPDLSPVTELYGYDIDGGTRDWAPLREKAKARADAYRAAIRALCSIDGIYLFRAAINLDRVNWADNNDPHDWALKILFEKIDREFIDKEPLLAICDDVGQRVKHRAAFSWMLMDRATLLAHETRWDREPVPVNTDLAHLIADEVSLYRDLVEDAFGTTVRLAQERIGYPILEAVVSAIGCVGAVRESGLPHGGGPRARIRPYNTGAHLRR